MMSSFVGASLPGVPPVHYTQDALLEDLSRQMAISSSRRQSRPSNGAYSGNAMRIVKPSSANNSPRNNPTHQRRRTMMNDPAFLPKTQQVLEQQYLSTPGLESYGSNYYEPVKRASRPMSWHPSTQLPQTYQQQYQQHQYPTSTQQPQYSIPNAYEYEIFAPVQMPSTPAAYSAYGSPVSTISPLILPSYTTTYELPPQQQHYASPSWSLSAAPSMPVMTQAHTPSFASAPASYTPAAVPSYAAEPSHSPASWNGNMPSTSYSQSMSAPATPEEPTNFHYPGQAMVKPQEGLHSAAPVGVKVEDDEDDGDILVGLGLYDPPEHLHGGLLGAPFEPTGKGLKLEDAWEPPVDDEDEEADDDNEADDAESEEE